MEFITEHLGQLMWAMFFAVVLLAIFGPSGFPKSSCRPHRAAAIEERENDVEKPYRRGDFEQAVRNKERAEQWQARMRETRHSGYIKGPKLMCAGYAIAPWDRGADQRVLLPHHRNTMFDPDYMIPQERNHAPTWSDQPGVRLHKDGKYY